MNTNYYKQLIYKQANLFTRKDVFIPGDSKDKNITLITGYSGSGKTTLGEELERQSKNNILIELDGFEHNYDSTGKHNIVNKFTQKNGLVTDENIGDMLPLLLNHIEDEAKNHPDNSYYLEGIGLLEDPSLFKKYPSIIKGTGLLKSSYRKYKREGNSRSLLDNIRFNARLSKDIDNISKKAALNEDIEFNPLQKRVITNPSSSMIVAHPVGSGKTLTGIAKFEKLKEQGLANRAVVITPAGLRNNFADEGVKKFTNSSANIIGNKGEIKKKLAYLPNPESDYNIISYEMFRKNPKDIIRETGADTIILDEIHRLKNEDTSTLDSFNQIKGDYKNFIGLTGSVISNKISDVYNLVDLASQGNHNIGESKSDFEDIFLKRSTNPVYKDLHKNRIPVVGFRKPEVLKKDLSRYVDYADIEDVRDIAKIPEKKVSIKRVPLSKEQSEYYKRLIKNDPKLAELIRRKRLETMKDDEVARAYSQLAEARKLVNSVGSIVPGINLQESAYRSPKTKLLLDDLQKHLETTPDGQAIVMSNLINGGADVLEAGLKDRGIEYGKFIGKGNKGVTEETRQQDVEDYKNRLKKVMIISSAGGEGISLGDTTWEGVLDPHYNPERMNQMEARGIRAFGLSDRPERDRKVLVNRYISTMPKTLGLLKSNIKTPDEIIYEIAERKDKQNQLMFNLLRENNKKQRT